MKVDPPPPIERVEALYDLGGRADGGCRAARPGLILCALGIRRQGLHHPYDARLGILERAANALGTGPARGSRAGLHMNRIAARRAKQALWAGQDGSGNRLPGAGRACRSRCLDHQHVHCWGPKGTDGGRLLGRDPVDPTRRSGVSVSLPSQLSLSFRVCNKNRDRFPFFGTHHRLGLEFRWNPDAA
jgi:hypothetical protein